MKKLEQINLSNVQNVYNGAEGRLWEFVMGEQIHIGGIESSMDLYAKSGISSEMKGVDFCCCSGAGIRFLLKIMNVKQMTGVDATAYQLDLFKERCKAIGVEDRAKAVLSTVENVPLDSENYDFVWGEDAWCYVKNKPAMIKEAARLIKKNGIIAFTDWLEGPTPMTDSEAIRFMSFMKFPSLYNLEDYKSELTQNGIVLQYTENTNRYAPCIDLYLQMISKQHTFDVLRILNFDQKMFNMLAEEMNFIQTLAHSNKIIQGLFVGKKH